MRKFVILGMRWFNNIKMRTCSWSIRDIEGLNVPTLGKHRTIIRPIFFREATNFSTQSWSHEYVQIWFSNLLIITILWSFCPFSSIPKKSDLPFSHILPKNWTIFHPLKMMLSLKWLINDYNTQEVALYKINKARGHQITLTSVSTMGRRVLNAISIKNFLVSIFATSIVEKSIRSSLSESSFW